MKREDTPLWRLGRADNSTAELSDYARASPEKVRARGGMDSPAISKGLRGDSNPAVEIAYELEEVPAFGVEFRFKLLHAHKGGPQMAVFSNGVMAGLVQLWGTAETTSPWPWRKTYRLYVPKEMLKPGANVLRLETARPLWSDPSVDRFVWWEWDYLAMKALGQPAREPVHGKMAWLGTTMGKGANTFAVDDDSVRLTPVALKWLGIAYSGNTVRCDFWWNVGHLQPRRREYLKLLRDLNFTACLDYISSGHFTCTADGRMPPDKERDLRRFFEETGHLFQWYEIANEPCMFGGGRQETLTVAELVNEIRPAHVKTTAPGWAYGGGKGDPVNWARDPVFRREVESLCQATNGHSYGFSYTDNQGGSFVENLETYEGVEDGWPKEYVNTETGANNWHSEENGPRFASTQPHAQAFDRVMRAHVAVVDRTMQHAALFEDFSLFSPPSIWAEPETLSAYPATKGEKATRVQTFRRLALAYATHGAPLPYEYADRAAVAGRKVYFRAVDTRAIPALGGSGGTSDKVLLNFVNFEPSRQVMKVRVTMPLAGSWKGERFGAGSSYRESRSEVDLKAGPDLELEETLDAGESVQYILAPPGPAVPYAPTALAAEPDADRVVLAWAASSGATSYSVARASNEGGPFGIVGRELKRAAFEDSGLAKGRTYWYRVSAVNSAGQSAPSDTARATVGAPRAPEGLRARPGDGKIALTWRPGAGVTGWNVKRSRVPGGPYETIARGVREPTFVHSGIANGEKGWYVVTALNGDIEGDPTPEVAAAPQTPPPAPEGLQALAGDGRVVLAWKPTPGATAYNVKRAPDPAGPFETVAENVGSTGFADDGARNGATWRYAVSGLRAGSEGPDSAPASARPLAGPLPPKWKSADIGSPGRPGKSSYNRESKVFTVTGSGQDIWGERDGLHFAYLPLAGDGSLTARVASLDDTHEWAKIGCMVRESLEPGSAMAIMALTPGKGSGFTFRKAAGGGCEMAGGDGRRWLRIQRKGARVTGYVSTDGAQWREFGAADIPMKRNALIGLAVMSHDNGRLNKALFERVGPAGGAGR